MINAGLSALRESGAAGCVVLGEPEYYGHFGFRNDAGCVLEGVPAEYFQVLAFGADIPVGNVSYHAAFGVEG